MVGHILQYAPGVPLSHKARRQMIIPTESLAIGPAMQWLALALSGVCVFAVAVTTVGDAIFKRLQRGHSNANSTKCNGTSWCRPF
jgi:hypothetical protein